MSIGQRAVDVDWEAKTSGSAKYTADMNTPDTVFAALVRSDVPSATVTAVDTGAALAMDGVLAVITAADLPDGATYIHNGGSYSDRPPLASDFVAFRGQEVAAVAAVSPEVARRAADAVRVSYRARRRIPTGLVRAVARGSKQVRPDLQLGNNISLTVRRKWGDAELAATGASVVAEGTFTYPQVGHACMETNSTCARWDPDSGTLEIWTSTQAPYFIRLELANALRLPLSAVICREVFVGGGFGSKSKISEHEVPTAALAMRLPGRRVLLTLSRAEEFAYTKSRHAFVSSLRVAADDDGQLKSIDGRFLVDNGAFNHTGPSVMTAGSGTVGEIYRPQAASYEASLVYTAKQPGGQFRGYGTPQVGFAIECLVDEVAEQVGMDPIELRIMNANLPDTTTLSGLRLQSARLVECLEAVRAELRWDERRHSLPDGHGLGIAVAIHGSGAYAYEGANQSSARVGVDTAGIIHAWFGSADAGTGQKTIIAQVVGEELQCSAHGVSVTMADTDETPLDLGAWSSRGTYFAAHAVGRAARRLRAELESIARSHLGVGDVVIRDGAAHGSQSSVPLGELVRQHPGTVDGMFIVQEDFREDRMESATERSGKRGGSAGLRNKSGTYSFAAHGVEVAVDRRTGEVRIMDYVAAHDVGRAINPTFIESQIQGGVAMGLGAALQEQLIYEVGKVANPSYLHYVLPRAPDFPPVRPVLIEGSDAAGPYSAKGIGEIPVVPCAPAIANAIYHAVGIRLRELPMTPDKVLTGLRGQRSLSRQVSLRHRPREWWVAAMRRAYPLGLYGLLHHVGTRFAHPRTPTRISAIERPGELSTALELVRREASIPMGGGTDILPDGVLSFEDEVSLVNLGNVRELGGIRIAAGGDLEIGASSTLAELAASPDVPTLLREAASGIAGEQIREVATIAGNLLQGNRCWFYRNDFPCYKRGGTTCPCYAVLGDHSKYHAALGAHRCQAVTPSDLAPAFAALDASVTVRRRGGATEMVPLARFYTGPGETVVDDGDLVISVSVPEVTRGRASHFEKLARGSGDFAMVSIAVVADIDRTRGLTSATVAFGAMSPTPWIVRIPTATQTHSAASVREYVARKLVSESHPLPRNGWKLDAAVGLLERSLDRLVPN